MIVDYLSRDAHLEVSATVRTEELAVMCRERIGEVQWHLFDASAPEVIAAQMLAGYDWAINAVGIIKPLIHDDDAFEIERALRVNALFPHKLAHGAEAHGTRVLQIATDCVYSGTKGHYLESDAHDAHDVYGKTKSLGEVYAQQVHHLRCSIIGPEFKKPKSLTEWFVNQERGGRVNGYQNHDWNGVTTLHFAKLCQGIIKRGIALSHVQHIIPAGQVTKYELLQLFARCYEREDVTITPTEAGTIIDRTLATEHDDVNHKVWEAAGYSEPPSVAQMVKEVARFDYRLSPRT